ncbi:preprotein translocase subunit SecD [Ectothiorhodospira haloalkaliphila]|uniref:Protein translocase subunit SecD n=1 Tax=Ectothiorhodospira haloalkaliphila TaxID=421628 RepID=W8KIF5_9GAMM|nr:MULTISPECIES: protein translocase subunit SecD [Ectothiorhodospira]AHK79569.1 preprotein translocase subunit SecD [Ectothiorhodospira haloalkaliphila]MCG5493028.1 protein translocase subunit SecD [Ectothiorhodospira variabilis]MCG5497251.1 protein translocase subunit SecD [Ectothiorhodospira variabilis]MCG5502357.1 protein translocase subunit SecD [Ectothiorhodospira variabilis]MCG5505877.1 protein translocase subunit SecD [Ectothiorhodospira variabilis]
MNAYPSWKYLLIVVVILVGLVYSLPNLFPEDPVVQIAHSVTDEVDEDTRMQIRAILEGRGVDIKAEEFDGSQMMLRFDSTDDQMRAADILRTALPDQHSVGLNLAPATPNWLRAINARPMSLGLDLRGGVHFLMEVDMDAVGDNVAERYTSEFRTVLRDERIRYLAVERDGSSVEVRFEDQASRDEARDLLRREYRGDLDFSTRQSGDTHILTANISSDQLDAQRRLALQQNITTLRNRVDELGVAEPVIQQQGENRIVVQLPGVQDTARAKEILGATATLEFRLVDEANDPFEAERTGRVPANSRLYYERDGNPVLLQRRVMLTGDFINDASSGIAQDTGGAAVFINLDGQGARIFSRVTGENIGRLMGVVFIETTTETVEEDGEMVRQTTRSEEVINVARIQDQLGRRFQITGLDSTREARNLALLLRAGALAAPMSIVEERTVGPSLGQDNIERGFNSVIIGFALVLVFMALYYRAFGLVANVALTLNLVLIVAILSMLQATLTLPGIAGIVLTVGMAVDANVLIFERIREEIRNGNSPQASIQAGYARALSTIADANITTLIAAVVLFMFGTGPIKGFAITLSIGILVSMFTALMVTRAIINLTYGRQRRLKTLSI